RPGRIRSIRPATRSTSRAATRADGRLLRSSSSSTGSPRSVRSRTSGRRLRFTSRSHQTRSASCRSSRARRLRRMRQKLVWFVPEEALDATRDAVFAAGAGRIGDYERCSWYAHGTGTFLAGEGADPAIGEVGREERVPELRVETVVPPEILGPVVRALLDAHPYEEVAFEVYPLIDVER